MGRFLGQMPHWLGLKNHRVCFFFVFASSIYIKINEIDTFINLKASFEKPSFSFPAVQKGRMSSLISIQSIGVLTKDQTNLPAMVNKLFF